MVQLDMDEGEEFVCPNCGCEIVITHLGEAVAPDALTLFRCSCGEEMHFKHPRGEEFIGVPMVR